VIVMEKRLLVRAAVVLSIAAAIVPALAGGAPTPVYSVSCASGVQTQATWQRSKVVQVTVEWTAPAGSGVTFSTVDAPASRTPPRGFLVTSTPSSNGIEPESTTVRFQRSDGVTDQETAACS
jgi:hypothetical protein